MTRKGRKSRKPISKARFNSPTMKAGINARQGVCAGSATAGIAPRSMKRIKSSSRIFATMNRRKGCAAASSPANSEIRPSVIGTMPCVQEASNTGCMTKKVRNSASPIRIGLGGMPGAPMALRSSDSTITMRAKAVAITSREGASESSPIKAVSCTSRAVAPGWPVWPRSIETLWAKATPAGSARIARTQKTVLRIMAGAFPRSWAAASPGIDPVARRSIKVLPAHHSAGS